MKLPLRIPLLFLLLLPLSLSTARPAGATLGEGADSVAKDRKALSAVKGVTTTLGKYTIQESASNATTVREYLNASGVVFAIAWNGMVQPDLTSLLGSYNSDFRNAQQQATRRRGQKQSRFQGENVIVETWGHMRDMQGRAYLPALIPTGVSLDEIK